MMKATPILIVLLFFMVNLQAQDYLIGFEGSGASTTVDSVKVENLSLGITLTLAGTDILHLVLPVGMDTIEKTSSKFLQIYPNPMIYESYIEFLTMNDGFVIIELNDIEGKLAVKTGNILTAGYHRYAVSGLKSGVYTIHVRSSDCFYSRKLVCLGTAQSNPAINYISGNVKLLVKNIVKSTQSIVPMPFHDGNQLIFTFYSGIFSTVIPTIPTQSQTVVANFLQCTDAEGHNYPTLSIMTGKKGCSGEKSEQIWMAQNLNVGTRINGASDQTDNNIIEKYCYNDLDSNCDFFGGLYQWNEMMQYDTTGGVQGICPDGWHIPTDFEWTTLTDFLGGEIVAGGKMKATGTIQSGTGLWSEPNAGATNSSGFTALPGGYRADIGGYFDAIDAYFWTGSQSNSSFSWGRMLQACCESAERHGDGAKTAGASVRCIKD